MTFERVDTPHLSLGSKKQSQPPARQDELIPTKIVTDLESIMGECVVNHLVRS